MSDSVSGTPPARAWWSRAILIGAMVAVALLPIGALGTRFGIWSFGPGLILAAAGTVLAAVGLVVGIAGIIAARRRNRRADLPAVYAGTAICLVLVGVMATQLFSARPSRIPPIHDITTDVSDPPQFASVVALRGEGTNPLDYDADKVGKLQLEKYPSIKPLDTTLAPAAAVRRSAEVLEGMGLEVVNVDETAGIVEAVATTFWYGFRDDVVVRVRESGAGSRIDVRSVSRVGVGDMGTNARRIGEFLKRFQAS
jgi:uncharacterized protein (DUF1499 family)